MTNTIWMEIVSNRNIAKDVYEMKLQGQGASLITAPGQFVNIKVSTLESQPYLRRPMSVCDYDENNLTIIYKVVGKGTKILREKQPGEKLDMLLGLGNGFPLPDIKKAVFLFHIFPRHTKTFRDFAQPHFCFKMLCF